MTEAGEADPPAQGSRLPWYQSTVLVGEDLGDFLPQIPGTQKGKSGEAPSAAGLSRHAGLWELFWGRITGRASALGQELQPHTLPHSAGSHQHSSNPLVHRLFNSPSPLTAAGPVHSRLIPAPTDTHPMQEERRTGVLPTPAALRASCIQGTPAPPPIFVEDGVGRKMQSETLPSSLSLPRLTEHLLLGPGAEAGNHGAFLLWVSILSPLARHFLSLYSA